MIALLGPYNSLFLAPEVSEEKLGTEKVSESSLAAIRALCPVGRGAKRDTRFTCGAAVAMFTAVFQELLGVTGVRRDPGRHTLLSRGPRPCRH